MRRCRSRRPVVRTLSSARTTTVRRLSDAVPIVAGGDWHDRCTITVRIASAMRTGRLPCSRQNVAAHIPRVRRHEDELRTRLQVFAGSEHVQAAEVGQAKVAHDHRNLLLLERMDRLCAGCGGVNDCVVPKHLLDQAHHVRSVVHDQDVRFAHQRFHSRITGEAPTRKTMQSECRAHAMGSRK